MTTTAFGASSRGPSAAVASMGLGTQLQRAWAAPANRGCWPEWQGLRVATSACGLFRVVGGGSKGSASGGAAVAGFAVHPGPGQPQLRALISNTSATARAHWCSQASRPGLGAINRPNL